jgi:hypothetical protein
VGTPRVAEKEVTGEVRVWPAETKREKPPDTNTWFWDTLIRPRGGEHVRVERATMPPVLQVTGSAWMERVTLLAAGRARVPVKQVGDAEEHAAEIVVTKLLKAPPAV